MKTCFTKAEAVKKAQVSLDDGCSCNAWLALDSGSSTTGTEIHYLKPDSGGNGGLVIAVPRCDDEEGVVVAVAAYSGEVKKFFWDEEQTYRKSSR